jgi:hypothetical protein
MPPEQSTLDYRRNAIQKLSSLMEETERRKSTYLMHQTDAKKTQ